VASVTAQPVPSRPTLAGRVRDLSAGAPVEALVLAAAVPPLFLHATYQPHASVGIASTSVDITLADLAIAAVVVAAGIRARRDGFEPLRRARWVLFAAAAFVGIGLLALGTPAVLGEDYDYAVHVVSALKLAWYALLLPATALVVRTGTDAVPLFRAVVLWSAAATGWGVLQFLGIVTEFQGKRPGQREPSFVGIHDFAALSGAALTLGLAALLLAGRRPLGGRSWLAAALVAGAVGLVLSGALTGVAGLWLAAAALLLAVRTIQGVSGRRALATVGVVLAVTAGAMTMRADAITKFAEFLGIRDRVTDTRVESYAQRTLLAYIGARIWLDHPIAGVGWQASSEEWAYAPYLDDARRRFPDEPDRAFPSAGSPWGVQNLYLQVLADLGIVGFGALVALFVAAVVAALRGIRGSPVPLVGLAWLLVAAGIWSGIGLVPGIPLAALTFVALALTTARG
jgi:O-antigen ligase